MAVLGIGATFAPDNFLAHVGAPDNRGLLLAVQAAGALYLGFAALNWMGRGSLIGGIYGRPIAIGNLTHFVVMTFALARVVIDGAPPVLASVAFVYAVFAVWFGWNTFFSSPVQEVRS